MLTLNTLIHFIVWLLIAGLVYWLVIWLLAEIGIPEPFNKIIRVVIALVVFLIALNALLSLVGYPVVLLR